jgi:hypothetical protein
MLVFRLLTIPDVAGLRLLHGLPAGLADNEVVELAYQKGRAVADISNAPDVLPHHLQRIVSIACAFHDSQQFRVVSLAQSDQQEKALIQRFADLIERENVQAISWNGDRFDLSVLNARGLVAGVSTNAWGQINGEKSGLMQRLHVSDETSMYDLAALSGFPHSPRLHVNQLWHAWCADRADEVHAQCETDAVIAYLLSLRFQLTRGTLSAAQYANGVREVRDMLTGLDAQPWREFLADWPG